MKCLLIGNGLNLTNKEANSFFENENINKRFISNLYEYWKVIHNILNLEETDINVLKRSIEEHLNDNIEKIAGIAFQYFQKCIESKRQMFENEDDRLIELLGEISIKSIFLSDNKFIIPKIKKTYVEKITNNYDKVFTLNYIESWDKNDKVEYLHGSLKKYIQSCSDIGSSQLSDNPIYNSFKKHNYSKISFKDIVFIPSDIRVTKESYVINGKYPSSRLVLSNDLYPYGGRDIYKELNNIDSIDLFGVSPYGDDAVINVIKKIRDKRIFVYKMNESEINTWKENEIDNCFIDSEMFIKEH